MIVAQSHTLTLLSNPPSVLQHLGFRIYVKHLRDRFPKYGLLSAQPEMDISQQDRLTTWAECIHFELLDYDRYKRRAQHPRHQRDEACEMEITKALKAFES